MPNSNLEFQMNASLTEQFYNSDESNMTKSASANGAVRIITNQPSAANVGTGNASGVTGTSTITIN